MDSKARLLFFYPIHLGDEVCTRIGPVAKSRMTPAPGHQAVLAPCINAPQFWEQLFQKFH